MTRTNVLAQGSILVRAFCLVILFLASSTGGALAAAGSCDPRAYGAVGDGTIDNAAAIQAAIKGCAAAGGGLVSLRVVAGKRIYLTSPITLTSHVGLELEAGVILRGTNDHTRYHDARSDDPYHPGEALVSAVDAVDTGITGQGTIDGQGGVTAADGGPSWWELTQSKQATVAGATHDRPGPWLVEFYRCSNVSVNGITFVNPPKWSLVFRYTSNITASEDTIKVTPDPSVSHTDAVDLIGSTHATLIYLNTSNGGASVALKSGRRLKPSSQSDPDDAIPSVVPTHDVMIVNSTFSNGGGITVSGDGTGGVYNVLARNITETGTRFGLMIRSDATGTYKATDIYNIVADNITLAGAGQPFAILAGRNASGPATGASRPLAAPASTIQDINISGVTATAARDATVIAGSASACIRAINLENIHIATKATGMRLRNMSGTFTNVTSKAAIGPAFVAEENVHVIAAGTTPAITATAKQPTPPGQECSVRHEHPI